MGSTCLEAVSARCEQSFKSPLHTSDRWTNREQNPSQPPTPRKVRSRNSSHTVSNRLTFFLARVIFSTLKMVAIRSSKTSSKLTSFFIWIYSYIHTSQKTAVFIDESWVCWGSYIIGNFDRFDESHLQNHDVQTEVQEARSSFNFERNINGGPVVADRWGQCTVFTRWYIQLLVAFGHNEIHLKLRFAWLSAGTMR
jgi:hypothetical protein